MVGALARQLCRDVLVPVRRDAAGRIVACDVPAPHAFPSMTPRRLHRSCDIRAVFAARNRAHGRLMTVHGAPRTARGIEETRPLGGEGLSNPGKTLGMSPEGEQDSTRVTVIAGKDVGGSVQRNRAKRRLRAALAEESLAPGFDLVVRARPATIDADFEDLRAELRDLIGRVVAKSGQTTRTGGTCA